MTGTFAYRYREEILNLMAGANGDLMTHSFLMMGGIIIAIYFIVVLGHMLVSKIREKISGTDERAKARKIMEQLKREEEEEKTGVENHDSSADMIKKVIQ